MTDPWHIAVEVPAKMWATNGRGHHRRRVQVPLGLPALHNQRGVWTIARIVAEQKRILTAALAARDGELLPPARYNGCCYDVLMVRTSRRHLDCSVRGRGHCSVGGDNVGSALKTTRDVLAKWLGLPNDNDPRVRWFVGQKWGPPKYVGVEVYLATWAEQWWELQDRFLRGEL